MGKAPEVLVLGSSPTGLYSVREAARSGLSVGLADLTRGCAFSSRYPAMRVQMGVDGLQEQLRAWHEAGPSPLLIPTSDLWIEAVIAGATEAPSHFRTFPAFADVAGRLLDKLAFQELCEQHGMATPGLWRADSGEQLAALAKHLPFPCILKPALIHRAKAFLNGKKVLLARTREEYLAHVATVPPGLGEWFVQEVIPGAESNITLFGAYIDRTGIARQACTMRKLRQYPAGFGSASLVASQPCEETLALSLGFLRKIGFHGICGAEYKRDPRDGRLKIIEINPRPTLWFQVIHDAGCRVVEAAWRDMAGQEPLSEVEQRRDVRWRYLLKDLTSARFYRRRKDFVFPAPDVALSGQAGRRSWPVFSSADPMPALAEPFGFLRKFLERRR